MEHTKFGLTDLTLGKILEYHSGAYPNDHSVIDLEQSIRYSYKKLNNRVNQCANMLTSCGTKKGDKICIFMNDRVEYIEILFAASKIGAIIVPCNYRFTNVEIMKQIDHSGCDLFIFSTDSAEFVRRIKNKLPNTTKLLIGVGHSSSDWYLLYDDLMEKCRKSEPVASKKITSSDEVLIIYTSGTTGIPKGVVHSHKSIIGWTFNSVYESGLAREDRILNPYPMFHFGGLIISVQALFAGACNFIFGKFDAERFLNAIEKEKITTFNAVPTIIHSINNLPEEVKNKHKMSSIKLFSTSSAPLYHETYQEFTRQWPHVKIISRYTATEFFFTCLRDRDQSRKVRCVGKPAFGNEIKILDSKGREVNQGELGLVYAKGISLFEEYYKNEEANKNAFFDDWFTCEDIGYFDEEGYLYLVDRAKDMIISGGENIASVEVENLLLQHPAVYECAVIGISDQVWGEKVHAVICLRDNCTAISDEIMDWCKGKIAGYKRPRSISIISEIPRNPAGKILKRDLRDRYNKGKNGCE